MVRRYQLKNDTHFVEFEFSPKGLDQARAYRKSNKQFARRQVRDMIQALPSQVELGKEYPW